MASTSEKLSRLDRYYLSNQLRILEALYPDDAKDLAVQREALERGYEMLYSWNMEYIYDGNDKMSVEESKEVWDTFDMFDAINRALEQHGQAIAEGFYFTKFGGYDGNNETKFMSFAAFTVERLHRFQYLPMEKPGYWNSHAPMRDVYNRMLGVWKKIPPPANFKMTKEQLIEVLQAATHPDHR